METRSSSLYQHPQVRHTLSITFFCLCNSVEGKLSNVAMHAEAGHYAWGVTSDSSLVQRDMDIAAAVALEEIQDGEGSRLIRPDGSTAA